MRRRLPGSHAITLLALVNQALVLGVQLGVARRLGIAGVVDAWVAAQAIPAVIASLSVALAGQLVLPALLAARERGGEAALRRGAGELLAGFGGLGLLLGGALALAPGAVLACSAPGLPPASREAAEVFLRLLALGLIPAGANALLAQAAHARGRFVSVAALGPLSAAGQLAAFWLAPPGEALRWMIATQAGLAFARLPLLWALAGRLRLGLRSGIGPVGGELVRRAGPALCIVASSRINLAVDTFFASSLAEGELALLGYAHRAVALVLAVLAAPVASVVFAQLSADAARADWNAFRTGVRHAVERGFFLSVGAALLLVALGERAAVLWFGVEPGAPGAAGFAACLRALSGLVVFGIWGSVLARVCLAARCDGLALLFLGVVPMLLNVGLDALLVGRFGVLGLAGVTSLNALIGLPIVFAVLRRRGVVGGGVYGPLLRFVASALPVGALLLALPLPVGAGPGIQAAVILGLAAAGAAAYALLVALSGPPGRHLGET